MQAVPSLVGTGTVVAAAAAGLAFGQPTESIPSRPTSNKRKYTSDYDNPRIPASLSRPGTSSAMSPPPVEDSSSSIYRQPPHPLASNPNPFTRQPRNSSNQITPPKASSRRQSFIRQGDWPAPTIAEDGRDSFSSTGSWMRRLSIRPLSQHGSPRSSVGPDSPSITFSHGSNAPILSPLGSGPSQLPPNKLVKRATSGQDSTGGTLNRRGSRSQMPTLRRPATSHQRSATLQQSHFSGNPPGTSSGPKYSFDQQARPRASTTVQPESIPVIQETFTWTSFFHSRRLRSTIRGHNGRSAEGSPSGYPLPNKRLQLGHGSLERVYLIKPSMLSSSSESSFDVAPREGKERMDDSSRGSPQTSDKASTTPEGTPSKRARRSISMHFSSPTNWISRSGSLRRPKRGAEAKNGGRRYVSAPVSSPQNGAQSDVKTAMEEIFTPPEHRDEEGDIDIPAGFPLRARKRNTSSPLPPLSRLSSFTIDLSRVGPSTPTSAGYSRSGQAHPTAPAGSSQAFSAMPQSRGVSNERASTFTSSELEGRDVTSGDDDDTDCRSDTMFDSLRTAGSNRVRTVETPLESMFDESPPSTAGNGKTKRLSIQEILGRSWDGDTKITEEDEDNSTPNRDTGSFREEAMPDAGQHDQEDLPDVSLVHRDFGRLSLDTEDEDWARDDENALTRLSPPSSSVNSRRGVSPQLRTALANISGNVSPESHHFDVNSERPRSNLFDWSEPAQDKMDVDGHSPRPKTVHGKQELDLRGGRPSNRKSAGAGHVRSQSVPVVPDPAEAAKAAPKFGTWGMGTKTASEDWDDDFDFEEPEIGNVPQRNSMIVPQSIQATQPTVKAHSGQIRELSLLVSSLKRLCRQGRDLDLLDGSAAALWKEAENIIALASPDEEDEDETDDDQSSISFEPSMIDERFLEEGFDAASLDRMDDPFEAPEPDIPKTAVVRERQVVRRRSVFSPEDDIFGGNWPLVDENKRPETPRTPDRTREFHTPDGTVVASVMEAMQQHRGSIDLIKRSPMKPSKAKLFFDTNSLQELVKQANLLFHTLSDLVRKAELLTQSPAGTPKHERHRRHDGSPAFTRVFTDPSASPPKRLPKSHSTNSGLSRTSIESPASTGISQRLQMMTVS